MSEQTPEVPPVKPPLPRRGWLYWSSLLLVVLGLMNATPGIPGYDDLVARVTGWDWAILRKFPREWFFPGVFALMMLVVVLKHSMWRDWQDRSPARRRFGLFMDIALLVAAFGLALTFLVEIEAVCLIDQITGERERLIAESLAREKETAALYGLPEPKTVDDPQCVTTTEGWLVAIMGAAIVIFLGYNIKVWGLPLVLVAILVAGYTIGTVMVWYVFGADDINKYLMTKLGGEPRQLIDGRPRVHDILVNNASGLLGRFMDIILNTIFPYLILGALFGASAGGQSLIKLAFRWTRKLNGGPAHAAIVSSAMFGTVSGGPIVNVLSTGVLTIPMMIRRGFSKVFAGGMEAAASSGGSIMPPVMGVAAFVLAALTAVPYSEVIVAAVIPALAYFTCLFLSVVYQARKQKIRAYGELTPEMYLSRQDLLNLAMIFGPILLILALLLTTKDAVGCGVLGGLLGAERVFTESGCRVTELSWFLQMVQNSAGDAGSAGWWAVALLMCLLFVDPAMRARPRKLFDALADAGQLISTLYLMFLAVSIIDFCLKLTGLPIFISLDVLSWLKSLGLGQDGSVLFQFLALLATMGLAVLLGMGMPAVPAYVNVALLMGPVLAGLGLAVFTAHMFVFYFAVASAITPPVALAAFAAASITKEDPMRTGFAAVKVGIMLFVIPFVFAMYPQLLLIEAAVIDPNDTSGRVYLPGHDGMVNWSELAVLVARLFLALLLLASALARFDRVALATWEWIARLALAALVMAGSVVVWAPAVVAGLGLLALHRLRSGAVDEPAG
ncbi:TRAP transporter permease [Pseudaestuariivita atlantica]|uniref:C4-dicarboxylate ABC transporter n=1 Tax=Pseudaestuariivita atlantica TaxID=1317121 RepID=A0A0L1JTM6_9RHOB|nr:TRAP transporter fused permease subunit [Pseudaestuariivita atlantica]KNG95116.1 C4-dicarboxylate ABC transporter [Pseudaestuariivita atlantica]